MNDKHQIIIPAMKPEDFIDENLGVPQKLEDFFRSNKTSQDETDGFVPVKNLLPNEILNKKINSLEKRVTELEQKLSKMQSVIVTKLILKD